MAMAASLTVAVASCVFDPFGTRELTTRGAAAVRDMVRGVVELVGVLFMFPIVATSVPVVPLLATSV